MKISGFTIARNAVKLHYPIRESIQSILPICDEFIVNVGDSDDGTIELIKSINSPKVKIIQTTWDMSQGALVLSQQTNIALKACRGDWAFYLQTDEVIHEDDLPQIKKVMQEHVHDAGVDALQFRWLHFYGSYYRYRIDRGWYQKQNRIIRANNTVESYGDAFGFRRTDGKPLQSKSTWVLLYHYGWVNEINQMRVREANAQQIGYADATKNLSSGFGDLNQFPIYFGHHPKVMNAIIATNSVSQEDWKNIRQRFWWNPALWLRLRYKTGRRCTESLSNTVRAY